MDTMNIIQAKNKAFVATRNACSVCTPLGACIAYKGIEGCLPLLHGSQGCSTYIRRYLISHYKEPVDIASTNFSRDATIFGGSDLFSKAIKNIIQQYNPQVIGIASTCLSETIGEDIPMLIYDFINQNNQVPLPSFVHTSTPSYKGSHMVGFHDAVAKTIQRFSETGTTGNHINLLPGFLSPEDLRYLKEILTDFNIAYTLFPDYSDTLDNPNWEEYHRISPGGTSIKDLKKCGSALFTLELGSFSKTSNKQNGNKTLSGGEWLKQYQCVDYFKTPSPIGIRETDKMFIILKSISRGIIPEKYVMERGRLVDSYIDGHKYVFGKKAVIYGEEDFVFVLASFLEEIGIDVVLCATGAEQSKTELSNSDLGEKTGMKIINGTDFETIASLCRELKPNIIIGNSKGYYIARELKIPMVRIGFPIHDRLGGQRVLHVGYRGAQSLFDKIVNALIEYKQDNSAVGYKYM